MTALTVGQARSQETAQRDLHRHAEIGQTVRLRGHVNYRGRCTNAIPTTIAVLHPPQHGTLSVRDEIVTSTDPALGNLDKCRGSSVSGKVVYYTRVDRGVDRFEYQSSSENGVVHVSATVD
jgi:hypothetical protein